MTGIVGKIVMEFERCVLPSQSDGHSFIDKLLKVRNIRRCVYEGSASFEGNQAKKILQKVVSLENYCTTQSSEIYKNAQPFLETLNNLESVSPSCFGQKIAVDKN